MAQKTVEWAPENSNSHTVFGLNAVSEESTATAHRAFRRATELDSKNAEAWGYLALISIDIADLDGAKIAAQKAFDLAPLSKNAIAAQNWIQLLSESPKVNSQTFWQMVNSVTLDLFASSSNGSLSLKDQKDFIRLIKVEHDIRQEAGRATTKKNSIGMEFLLIDPPTMKDGGRFEMGTQMRQKTNLDNETQHRVRISKRYGIGITEITQSQYQRVMRRNPSDVSRDLLDLPVDSVSWTEANEFCQKLSDLPDERAEGRTYRLPTEAEWEYACRAGSVSKFHYGDEDRWIRKYAWLESPTHQHKTIPVAQRAPNRWGLYDMYGNVAEWCSDWFSDVPNKEETDPTGPESGVSRVIRGGSSNLNKSLVDGPPNSSTRSELKPDEKSAEVGFRVVLHVE